MNINNLEYKEKAASQAQKLECGTTLLQDNNLHELEHEAHQ